MRLTHTRLHLLRFFIFALTAGTTFLNSGCTLTPKQDTSNLNILERGYMGLRLSDALINLKKPVGECKKALQVSYVIVNDPAWNSGLRIGDMTYQVDGECIGSEKFKSPADFTKYTQRTKPGTIIKLNTFQNRVSGQLSVDGKKTKDLSIQSKISGADELLNSQESQTLTAEWTINRSEKLVEVKIQNWLGYTEKSEAEPTGTLEQELKNFKFSKPVTDLTAQIEKHKLSEEWNKVEPVLKATALRVNSLQPALVNYMFTHSLDLQKNQNWVLQQLQMIKPNQAIENSSNLLMKISSFEKQKPLAANTDSVLYHLASELNEIKKLQNKAFENLTTAEIDHLEEIAPTLFTRHAVEQYISMRNTLQTTADTTQAFDELSRVHIQPMLQAHVRLSRLLSQSNLKKIREAAASYLGSAQEKTYVTTKGHLLLRGTASHRHIRIDQDIQMIIDLGGDDFYYNVKQSILDFGGHDSYEASFDWLIGSAFMGVKVLIDTEGDDRYIGREGAFGAALLGVSLFADLDGNDEYRCTVACQGVAIAGVGTFIDIKGNDRYEATLLSQGVAVAGGYNLFLDLAGHDSYYSKGQEASSYDDPGQFAGWSQGVAIGLRPMAAGGVSLMYDKSGQDRFEAGTFSQGGGYYYALGQLVNDGTDDDVYVGSRYTQGFSAHQAIGGFIDIGGNEKYISNSDVGEGMSWDLSMTYFEDRTGHDTYQTCAHCLGSAAQTGLTVFIDQSGNDTYKGDHLPFATDVENDYHKFNSFGFFFDLSGEDEYSKFKNNSDVVRPKYQILTDSK